MLYVNYISIKTKPQKLFLSRSPKPIANASLHESFLPPCWQNSVSPLPPLPPMYFQGGKKGSWGRGWQKFYSSYVQSTDDVEHINRYVAQLWYSHFMWAGRLGANNSKKAPTGVIMRRKLRNTTPNISTRLRKRTAKLSLSQIKLLPHILPPSSYLTPPIFLSQWMAVTQHPC